MVRMSTRGKKQGHGYGDKRRGPRLQKVLADAGVASRRACESLIESGMVTVNGEVVDTLPAWVDPEADRIVAEGRVVGKSRRNIYVMLFKPRGTVSTNSDPEGRRRAIDLVQHPSRPRLYPVGRLDVESSGLLLMTNDGELANRLTHPRYGVHKGYQVTVGGRLSDEDVERLEQGIFLSDKRSGGASRTKKSNLTSSSVIVIERCSTWSFGGRNRQIRRMMAQFGFLKKLRRVRMGPLALKGLAPGEWRELASAELSSLRRAAYRIRDKPLSNSRKGLSIHELTRFSHRFESGICAFMALAR